MQVPVYLEDIFMIIILMGRLPILIKVLIFWILFIY